MSVAEKLTTIAENEQKVYEAGKQSQYDLFWDIYQENGKRTNCTHMFAGRGWRPEMIKPKYDIKPTDAYMMFYHNYNPFDLVELLKDIVLDFSNCTNLQYAFGASSISRLGVIDCSKATQMHTAFSTSTIITIEELISSATTTFHTNTFNGATGLINLNMTGTVAKDGLNLQWSTKLSKASITSIINALSNETSGLTVTFSSTAKSNAFTDEEWATLIATKPNWTISLA